MRSGRVFVADGNKHFNRSSSAVLASAEIAAEALWPELRGRWAHHGERWVHLSELAAFADLPPPAPVIVATRPSGAEGAEGAGPLPPARSAPPADDAPPEAVVLAQVAALQAGDAAAAYELNTRANAGRLGGARAFLAIVAGSPAFCALLQPSAAFDAAAEPRAANTTADANEATVRLQARGGCVALPGGALLFDLRREAPAAAWRTERVRPCTC